MAMGALVVLGRAYRILFRPNRLRRTMAFMRCRAARRQLALIGAEMAQAQDILRSRPVYLVLDPGAICNLRCPHCPTGSRRATLGRQLLEPEVFARIVRHLPIDSLVEVCLFNWGEPLLNPNLADYVAWFAQKGIRVTIHANCSARDYDDAYMELLVRSGVTNFVASVDGASQTAYEKYRVGGDLARVIANLRRLEQARRRLHSETPTIVYKMLLNRYNENEKEDAQRIAASLGVEFQADERLGMGAEDRDEWMAESVRKKHGENSLTSISPEAPGRVTTECRHMWDTLVVHADGAVLPCCLVSTAEHAVGNLADEDFDTVRNNDKMRYLRRFALDPALPAPVFPNACNGCFFRYCTYYKAQRLSAR